MTALIAVTPFRAKALWRDHSPAASFPNLTIPEDAYVGRVSRVLNTTSWVEALFAIAAGKLVAMGALAIYIDPDADHVEGPFEIVGVDHLQGMALVRLAEEGSTRRGFPINIEHLAVVRYALRDIGIPT